MKECIQVTKRYENEGLGKARKKMNDTWWENSYNNILTKIKTNKDSKEDHEENIHFTRSRSNSVASINIHHLSKGNEITRKQRSRRHSNASNHSNIKIKSKIKKHKSKIIKLAHSDDEE